MTAVASRKYGSLVWEDSVIGGSAFRNFIRSLSALKYCLFLLMHTVHTYSSVPFKETVRKRELFRSRLYEQLRRRPKHRFPQNRILYMIQKQKRVRSSQKNELFAGGKICAARVTYPDHFLFSLFRFFKKKSSSSIIIPTEFCHAVRSHQR